MIRACAGAWAAIVATALVACLWLNQTGDESEWPAFRQEVFTAPAAHVIDTLRYPFAYLYRRGSDVRLYYELSNMILGRRANADLVERKRGWLPPTFSTTFPPADGKWHTPYAEVPIEYPALSLPFTIGPRLLVADLHEYGFVFGALMGLSLVGAVVVSLDAARAAGADERAVRKRAWLASALLVAQGGIAIQRLDAITALWVALAVRAAVRRQPLALGVWAGLAAATKIVPALLLPALLAADPDAWRDRRAAGRLALGFGGALALGLGPMFWFSPHALSSILAYHAARGLHCESTLGFALATIRLALGTRTPATLSFGSDNLSGAAANALAALCGPLSVAAVLGFAWFARRGAANRERPASEGSGPSRVACAAVAALTLLWLTGKVFSPQYMTWGLPIVLAVPGALGVRLSWLLAAAMAATQFYVCSHYHLVLQGRALGLLNLGAREALLALLGYLAISHVVRGARASPLAGAQPV